MNSSKSFDQFWVIILAAGNGVRMRADLPKQYLKIHNKTILEHTLAVFEQSRFSAVVLALSKNDPVWPNVKPALKNYSIPIYEALGGQERCHSVFNAMTLLKEYASEQDWVLVHDAARPCVSAVDISRLIDELRDDAVGGLLASPVKDTLKKSDGNGSVVSTIDRHQLWRALTPQMFRFELLYTALQQSMQSQDLLTDDASAIENMGHRPRLIKGSSDNIKITTPEDLTLAEHYLSRFN